MEIIKWQKLFVKRINKKYPNKWTLEQRIASLRKQLKDIKKTKRVGKIDGISLQTRIADVFPDLFMLCEDYGVKIEKELKLISDWFNSEQDRSKH